MSFTIANWTCISGSLSQGQELVAGVTLNAPNLFTYASPTDTVSTITSTNYFLSKYTSLSVGDIILGSGTDGTFGLIVTTVSISTVTVQSFFPSGSGTVSSITAGTGLTGGTITSTGTIALAIPVSIADGGTGVTSVTIVPTATSFAGWDSNKNLSANNFISGLTTTPTAASSTTLTVASTFQQYFTGSTTQTVILPVTSTLVIGQQFLILNNSSGAVTVQSSGGNTIQVMAANTALLVTCVLTSGTSAASWYADYNFQTTLTLPLSLANGGTNAALTASAGSVAYSNASMLVLSGVGSSGQIFQSAGTGAPVWTTSTYPATNAVNTLLYASSANVMAALATSNSAVLVTSAGGVPSLSTTLPAGLTIPGYQTSLTLPLSSANGGTGVASPTAHGVMVAEGASAMTPIVLSAGQVLIGTTAGDPTAAAINSGTSILVGNSSGSITIGLSAIASNDILSNITGGSAAPIANTLTATIDAAIGSTQGDILYRNATSWVVLAPGTSGNLFQTQGAAANPQWTTSTYPATNAVNTLLYASSANVMAALATANNSVLVTSAGGVPSLSTTLPSGLTIPGYQATLTLPLSIANGGTAVSSVTIAPTVTAFAGWDANKNLSANNFIEGFTTTATAAGTTTLTVSSTEQQYFTGSTTQTVVLPVTSTMVLGQKFIIVNNSSGVVTVQSSGANSIQAMAASTVLTVTVILTSGTTAASWNATYQSNAIPGGSNPWSAGAGTGSAKGGDGTAVASGNYSLAFGTNTVTASGLSSFAIGSNARATLGNAIAMGQNSTASGANSVAIGNGSIAGGTNSGAFGNGASSAGGSSTAIGPSATTVNSGSMVLGDGSGAASNSDTASNQFVSTFVGGYSFWVGSLLSMKIAVTSGATSFLGTNTNNNATAGFVGEVISSSITQGSGVALTSVTSANVTSISLTAGDWDVYGNTAFLSALTTNITDLNGWISTTSATIPAGNLRTQRSTPAGFVPGVSNESFVVPFVRLSLASTTTVYLSVQANFSVSTLEGSGGIYARRAR